MLDKIFLIDDDPVTNFINEDIIVELHLVDQIEVFTEAKDALACLHKCPQEPDLILLDLNMPGFNGFDFIEALQTVISQIKIVVLTSSKLNHDLERLKALGITNILSKPLTKEKMLSVV